MQWLLYLNPSLKITKTAKESNYPLLTTSPTVRSLCVISIFFVWRDRIERTEQTSPLTCGVIPWQRYMMGILSVSGPWSKHRLSLRLFFNWKNERETKQMKKGVKRDKVKMKKRSNVCLIKLWVDLMGLHMTNDGRAQRKRKRRTPFCLSHTHKHQSS